MTLLLHPYQVRHLPRQSHQDQAGRIDLTSVNGFISEEGMAVLVRCCSRHLWRIGELVNVFEY